ncbi:MAG: type II toxin-antitoxin system VapC family toxin [Candidatus Latescibacterota bacterium]
MRYWDASAVVALCVDEPATAPVQDLLGTDQGMAVWWATPGEAASAFARLRRMGAIGPGAEQTAREVLTVYRDAWTKMLPSAVLRDRAVRLLSAHDVRAADALQLAAAVGWAGESRAGREFVCLDERLSEAARREGFRVLPTAITGEADRIVDQP